MYAMAASARRHAASCRLEDSMRHPALVCSMLVLLTAWTSPAAAEWFVDLYLGLAATQSSDIETNFPAGVTTTRTLDGAEERHGRGARRLLVPQAGVDRGAVRHRY